MLSFFIFLLFRTGSFCVSLILILWTKIWFSHWAQVFLLKFVTLDEDIAIREISICYDKILDYDVWWIRLIFSRCVYRLFSLIYQRNIRRYKLASRLSLRSLAVFRRNCIGRTYGIELAGHIGKFIIFSVLFCWLSLFNVSAFLKDACSLLVVHFHNVL